jgi:hypothetical protein
MEPVKDCAPAWQQANSAAAVTPMPVSKALDRFFPWVMAAFLN